MQKDWGYTASGIISREARDLVAASPLPCIGELLKNPSWAMLFSHLCVQEFSLPWCARVPSSLCCFLKASTLSPALHWIRSGVPWVARKWLFWNPHDTRFLASLFLMEVWADEGPRAPPMWYHRRSAALETCDAPPGAWGLVPGELLPCCIGSVLPLALLGLSFQLVWKWSSVGVCRGMVCSMLRKRLRALFLRLCCLLLGACSCRGGLAAKVNRIFLTKEVVCVWALIGDRHLNSEDVTLPNR